ncbi:MAG: hypothetical protein H7269_08370 [Cellulomonas sp.]|nr:hypothetical protein [Cellulomonas sp.]
MARNFMWTDDYGRLRTSTEIFDAADVTEEILKIAKALDDRWFANYLWIDWTEFFRDLNGSVIPSTGRELELGEECTSAAMHRIQRCIQKRRMSRIARWRLVAARRSPDEPATSRSALYIVPAPPDATPSGPGV